MVHEISIRERGWWESRCLPIVEIWIFGFGVEAVVEEVFPVVEVVVDGVDSLHGDFAGGFTAMDLSESDMAVTVPTIPSEEAPLVAGIDSMHGV